MKRKLLSLALALAACLSLLPAPAAALSDGTFEYTISDSGVKITKLLDRSIEHLNIPSVIDGKPVVSIAEIGGILEKNETLKSVEVPASVKTLESYCFSNAANLTSVKLSEGLEAVGPEAFCNSGITSIVLPESVKTLGGSAFQGNGVFGGCGALTSVKLSSRITEIPDRCFQSCVSLKTVELPSAVRKIGEHAFGYSGIERLTIPTGVTVIPDEMFTNCAALRQVELPAGLKTIENRAFECCTSLESILLPTSLKDIGLSAFFGSGLKEVILPYGMEACYSECFDNCESLTAIYAPSTLDKISTASPDKFKPLVYGMPKSAVLADCEKRGISCLSDPSCDTRINVIYNGKRISFGAYGQNPTAVNGRTMVPLRSIFEAMGAEVTWDQASSTVTATRGAVTIVMTLGQPGYTVNGVSKVMDTPPMAMNSRTMVPVRVVAESFGSNVSWHGPSATVLINE